ncbi:hypothetical protein KC930_02975 [Candidatus Saccharibacteria bacterium]|nr:hypothetical protein [Candidatus Saccharibacteria bacterium]
MSEKLTHVHEAHENDKTNEIAEKRKAEILNDAHEKAESARNDHAENLKNLRQVVEQEAKGKEQQESARVEESEPEAGNTYWYSKEYRELAYKQLLNRVRKHLNPADKFTSKLIHNTSVEKVSEFSSKTIARPSGVLMGSLFSFISSLSTYLFAKQHGYDMSFGIFIIAFAVGFAVGVIIELSIYWVRLLLSRD